jgi:hypothetical protein
VPLSGGSRFSLDDSATHPEAAVRSELGPSLEGSERLAQPSASVQAAVQAPLLNQPRVPGEVRIRPGPEEQAYLQANQVANATLDADDNVGVWEVLLQANAVPTAVTALASPAGTGPQRQADSRAAGAAAPETAADPPPLARWVKWLALPAAVVFTALGWRWCRDLRAGARKPARLS